MRCISIKNAKVNNLKNVNVDIPLNQLVVFVGKSGSGKSTLAADVIIGGFLTKNENTLVPEEPALFRQRVSIPSGNMTVAHFLNHSIPVKDECVSRRLISIVKSGNRRILALLTDIAAILEMDGINCGKCVSELSLTIFNKIRFLKFLEESTAKLLIIDELAAGMSYAEARKVVLVFRKLVNAGYSVLAAEHSMPIIDASDYVVEMGPGAGTKGGSVVFSGVTSDYKKTKGYRAAAAATSQRLAERKIERRTLKIENINFRNLNLRAFSVPSNCIVNICGLAGTGKSSLLDIIYRAYDKSASAWKNRQGIDGKIGGKSYVRRPHFVEQTPIGANSMSTPATYTKIMDILRDMFAQSDDSVLNGYTASDFSYNSDGGCKTCGGKGVRELSISNETVFNSCSACKGSRYRDDVNKVLLRGMSIGRMLSLPCGDLIECKFDRKTLMEKIGFIVDVGLSYLTLGQPSPTLSGGESQRIKITKELAKKLGDRSLFLLDTPSRGLHATDFERIFLVLRKLVSKNNSVIIGDNNPYFIRNADWVVYLDNNGIAYQGPSSKLPEKMTKTLGMESVK